MGKNLDSRIVFWQVANEHHAFFLIHPNNVAGADRLKKYYLNNLIGNPLDTTIAAASLVFGGVIERLPNSKFFGHAALHAVFAALHVSTCGKPKNYLKKPLAETIRTLIRYILHPSRSLSSRRSSAPYKYSAVIIRLHGHV
jgi:aminocarboxymuconate-semialdehyde decarboxylase